MANYFPFVTHCVDTPCRNCRRHPSYAEMLYGLRCASFARSECLRILGAPERRASELLLALVQRFVMLNARDAKARHAGTINRALPRGEFLERETIAFAGLVDREQTTVHGGYDFRLATNDPTGRRRGRQRVQRQELAERADDMCGTYLLVLDHSNLKFASCAEWIQPSVPPS